MDEEPTNKPRVMAVGRFSKGRRTIITELALEKVVPNPEQPRRYFDDDALADLAGSIRDQGVLQPIIVRLRPDGTYLLVAGERRYRASKLAEMGTIPALVTTGDPLEIAMVENIQREDLTPLETASGIAELIKEHAFTHADVAKLIHKSRPYVSNSLALLKLPDSIREEYNADPSVPRDILISVARQGDEAAMLAVWKRAKLERLSVKQFREETGKSRDSSSGVGKAIRTARRLGRVLAELPDTLEPELRVPLGRTLKRLRRRIDFVLGDAERPTARRRRGPE